MKHQLIICNAKINIGLNITKSNDDGYHDLDMVMVPLKYHDSILMNVLGGRVTHSVTVDDFSIQIGDRNLVSGALKELAEKYNFDEKFRVLIHKLIPIQGGYGGGSSDAAGALIGANTLLNLGLSNEQLKEIGLKLGADIPFFIENKPMRCKGRGEKMTPITIKNKYYVLLSKPEEGCSTKVVYANYDKLGGDNCDIDKVIECLANGDDETLANILANSLQRAAISMVPEIQTLIDLLKSSGLSIVSMTGSGSGVFAMSTSKKLIKNGAKLLSKKGYFAEISEILQ